MLCLWCSESMPAKACRFHTCSQNPRRKGKKITTGLLYYVDGGCAIQCVRLQVVVHMWIKRYPAPNITRVVLISTSWTVTQSGNPLRSPGEIEGQIER
jgi:hypothetical protein